MVDFGGAVTIADGKKVANDRVESYGVSCPVKFTELASLLLRRLVIKDVTGCLLLAEQVVDVGSTGVGHCNEDAWTERRPHHLHHVLIVARLKHDNRPLVEAIVKAHRAIGRAGQEEALDERRTGDAKTRTHMFLKASIHGRRE